MAAPSRGCADHERLPLSDSDDDFGGSVDWGVGRAVGGGALPWCGQGDCDPSDPGDYGITDEQAEERGFWADLLAREEALLDDDLDFG